MFIRNLFVSLIVAVSALGCTSGVKQTEISEFELPRQATHMISNEFGSGSGVMIAPNLMLTAAHVAIHNNSMSPLQVNEKPVKIVLINEEIDIALIEVQQGCPCIDLGKSIPKDSKVVIVGYPVGKHLAMQVVTEGRVQGVKLEDKRLISTAPAAPGNSGGGTFAMIDGQWKLVGILVEIAALPSGIFGSIPVFHISRSVDIDTIKEFLKYINVQK